MRAFRELKVILLAPILALPLLAPAEAHAGPSVGADANLVLPVDLPGSEAGGGFDVRLGQRIGLPLLFLTPELKGGYASFSGLGVGRIMVGARAGIDLPIQPGAFLYAGYGHETSSSRGGFQLNAGAFLDVSVSILSVGAHAAYNHLALSPGELKTIDVGLHATLAF